MCWQAQRTSQGYPALPKSTPKRRCGIPGMRRESKICMSSGSQQKAPEYYVIRKDGNAGLVPRFKSPDREGTSETVVAAACMPGPRPRMGMRSSSRLAGSAQPLVKQPLFTLFPRPMGLPPSRFMGRAAVLVSMLSMSVALPPCEEYVGSWAPADAARARDPGAAAFSLHPHLEASVGPPRGFGLASRLRRQWTCRTA